MSTGLQPEIKGSYPSLTGVNIREIVIGPTFRRENRLPEKELDRTPIDDALESLASMSAITLVGAFAVPTAGFMAYQLAHAIPAYGQEVKQTEVAGATVTADADVTNEQAQPGKDDDSSLVASAPPQEENTKPADAIIPSDNAETTLLQAGRFEDFNLQNMLFINVFDSPPDAVKSLPHIVRRNDPESKIGNVPIIIKAPTQIKDLIAESFALLGDDVVSQISRNVPKIQFADMSTAAGSHLLVFDSPFSEGTSTLLILDFELTIPSERAFLKAEIAASLIKTSFAVDEAKAGRIGALLGPVTFTSPEQDFRNLDIQITEISIESWKLAKTILTAGKALQSFLDNLDVRIKASENYLTSLQ